MNAPLARAAGWVLAALLVGSVAARGEGLAAEPEDTARGFTFPAYRPSAVREPSAVRDWCDRALAAGRARAGTREGGDWVLSAATALRETLGDREAAAAGFEEAAAAYPKEDLGRAMAWSKAAETWAEAGRIEDAERAFGALEGLRREARFAPEGAEDELDARRDRMARQALGVGGDLLGVRLDRARGRFASAAERLEDLASRPKALRDAVPPHDVGAVWSQAADLRRRAGDYARAHEDATRAIETSGAEIDVVHRTLWRLFLDHGVLAEDGSLPVLTHWPGEEFERDLDAALRGLEGRDVGTYLLTLGSGALRSGRAEAAFRLYALALRDGGLLDRARTHPEVSRGLLLGVRAAAATGRFDEAERWIDLIASLGGLPRPEVEDLRAYVRDLRDGAVRAEAAREADPSARAEAANAVAASREEGGRVLAPAEGSGEADEPTASPDEDTPLRDPASGVDLLGLSVLGIIALAVVVLVLRARSA